MKIWILRQIDGEFKKDIIYDIKDIRIISSDIVLLFDSDFKYYSYDNLSASDKKRLKHYPNLADKIEFKISRSLKTAFEKSYINIDKVPLYYSISHSNNHAILAISTKFIGVDLELIKNRNFDIHMEYCFSNHQIFRVENLDNKLIEFYKIWTLKETQIKLLNLGFYAIDKVGDEDLMNYSDIIESGDMKFIYTAVTF